MVSLHNWLHNFAVANITLSIIFFILRNCFGTPYLCCEKVANLKYFRRGIKASFQNIYCKFWDYEKVWTFKLVISYTLSSIIFIIYELIRKMNWIDSTRCDDSLCQLWYITFPFLTLQRATYFDSPRHWLTSLFTCSLNIFLFFLF